MRGRNERAFAVTMLCGFIGVLFAIILQLLNDAEIIIDAFITSTTILREVQAIIIILWIVLGVAIAAARS